MSPRTRRPERGHRSPTVRFAVASLVVVLAIGAVLSVVLAGLVRDQALADARRSAQVISEVAFAPHLDPGDFSGSLDAAHRAALDTTLAGTRSQESPITAIRLWSADGRAIWADDPAVVGTVHAVAEDFEEALDGEVASDLFDEDSADRPAGTRGALLEVYVPITYGGTSRPVGVFELYLPYQPVAAAIAAGQHRVQLVLGGGLLGLYLVLLPIVAAASRRLRRQSDQNEWQALHDSLTALPNRLLLADRTGQALALAARTGDRTALLLLDLDRFKEINDTLGHHVGDRLLVEASIRMADRLRVSDTLARLGGDEFAVLLPRTDEVGAREVAAALRAALGEPFDLGDLSVSVEASVGVAVAPADGQDPATLLQRADVAMYAAKSGHTGVETYTSDIDDHSPARLTLLADLRRAIEEDQLLLHYQPKCDLRTGRLAGLEVLVRWQHPERGVVPPDQFIPLAERTGLIHPLTHWVLDHALAQLSGWLTSGHRTRLAVNVSARNLTDPGFAAEVAALLHRHQVPAELLEVEITESALVTDPVRAEQVLRALADMGCTLAMDDFGTGFSCLANLDRLPLDTLKIDKSFTLAMETQQDAAAIVQSVIDLGRNLGLTVVAEGVETDPVRADLLARGCHVAQGYLFSRPLPADQALDLIAAWAQGDSRTAVPVAAG